MTKLRNIVQEITDKLAQEGKVTIISKEKSQEIKKWKNEKMKRSHRELWLGKQKVEEKQTRFT